MTSAVFMSYSQNREDVVLRRALAGVTSGRYVDVGANHPRTYSISRGFYEQGWSGITVEPVPVLAEMHRHERPRDHQVEAVATSDDASHVTFHLFGESGLSTLDDSVRDAHVSAGWDVEEVQVPALRLDAILDEAGWSPQDPIHFLTVDVEGAEASVLDSIDLHRWRPWVLVVEATVPLSSTPSHQDWEPAVVAAGYQFCFFDGLSRFYVAQEHADLAPQLSYPACPHDVYDTDVDRTRRETITALSDDVVRWRTAALTRWAAAVASENVAHHSAAYAALEAELEQTRRTLSWRVTAPLRAVRRLSAR
ncbi:FkbM family methyltransferase [Actinotalea sp.]|uniref:FkbM family methyltransferase n=1 Tax=Actinotalea sp. TaxID=1872145 RepID=UPI0035664794